MSAIFSSPLPSCPLAFWASLREKKSVSDTLVLRAASPADAKLLAETIAAAFAQYRGKLVPESSAFKETPEAIAAQFRDGAGAIIAERDGKVLGCVMTEPLEGDLYFGRLAVLPEARGSGVARRLVGAVEQEARRRGLPGVRLGVRIALPDNQRLFASLGYREISREAHSGFDHPTSINMRKALGPS
jgi:ribosomal protein S18 acetylase RimI-like enzyme